MAGTVTFRRFLKFLAFFYCFFINKTSVRGTELSTREYPCDFVKNSKKLWFFRNFQVHVIRVVSKIKFVCVNTCFWTLCVFVCVCQRAKNNTKKHKQKIILYFQENDEGGFLKLTTRWFCGFFRTLFCMCFLCFFVSNWHMSRVFLCVCVSDF